MVTEIRTQFTRDLNKLRDEIQKYPSEESLWLVRANIANSGGNLCLHLVGNLLHFIGAILGKSGYIRNREAEFSSKNIARSQLLSEIDTTIKVVEKTLSELADDRVADEFPVEVLGRRETTGFMLMHFLGHLNYHLGQINYHRRIVAEGS